MNFTQLNYFMVVMEEKNFTKAAKVTFTSQPNISKQILLLEQEIGVQFFYRLSTGVVPTPAAEEFYAGLTKFLPNFEMHINNVKKINSYSNIKSILKLGLCETMDIELITPCFFQKYKEVMPNTDIYLESHPIKTLIEKLVIGELDIIFLFSVYDVKVSDIKRLPLTRKNEIIYYSKLNPLYMKKDLTVWDFKDEVFIRPVLKNHFYNVFNILPYKPKKIIEVNSTISAFINIESNNAVGIFGQSHYFVGHNNITTFEIKDNINMVGTDAIWIHSNKNIPLQNFVTSLTDYICSKKRKSSK